MLVLCFYDAQPIELRLTGQLHICCQSNLLECLDDHPCDINLVVLKTMASRELERMVTADKEKEGQGVRTRKNGFKIFKK